MKAPIQPQLCLTDEWEAHSLKVPTAATKLATHSGGKESDSWFVVFLLSPSSVETANWELCFTTQLAIGRKFTALQMTSFLHFHHVTL